MVRFLLLLLLVVTFLVGCGGGGGGGTTKASPSISVDWPVRTRNVAAPNSGLSVSFSLENSAQTKTYVTITANRDSNLAAHTETYTAATKVQTGNYLLVGTFYSQASEGGIVVATVSAPVAVTKSGALANQSGGPLGEIAFDGVVKSVAVAANQQLTTGSQLQLVVTAMDANFNVLALTPGSFSFSVTNGGSFLTVTPSGVASGVAAGLASVQASVDGVTSPTTTVTVVAPTAVPSISVDWPVRTRNFAAPNSGLSVSLSLENAAQTLTYFTLDANRDSNLAAHTETYTASSPVPVGNYLLVGTFYSQENQGGIVTATVSAPVAVSASGALTNQNGQPLGEVAFDGVVKSVAVAANQQLLINGHLQLVVTAMDANSNVLALTPGSFSFSVTNGGSFLTVSPSGVGSGVAAGQASVQASVDGVTSPATTVTVLATPTDPVVSVDWPLRTRNFAGPSSALSATFDITDPATNKLKALINANRDTNLAAHTETYTASSSIEPGVYTLSGTFYSQANQSGIVTANVSAQVLVSDNGTLEQPNGSPLGEIQFTGVVRTVTITSGQKIAIGSPGQIAVGAKDSQGNLLAITPGSFDFSVASGSTFLSITPSGVATGLQVGQASVVATCDGVSSTPIAVTVTSPTSFVNVFRFTQNTDTIALTGGSLNGACPLGSSFTVEMVFRPTSSADGYFWQQWTDSAMNEQMTESSSVPIAISTGSAQPVWTFSGSTVNLNKWNHFAWCYDGTNVTVYENGQLVSTTAAPTVFDPIVVATACAIGRNAAAFGGGDPAASFDLASMRISSTVRYTGSSYTVPTAPFSNDGATMLILDPSSFGSAPTSFLAPGTQGITGTLGAGSSSATSPTWIPYTP